MYDEYVGTVCIKIMLTVLSVDVAVTGVCSATVHVLRLMDITLVFRKTFALSGVLSRVSFNLLLTQAGNRLTAGRIVCSSQQIVTPICYWSCIFLILKQICWDESWCVLHTQSVCLIFVYFPAKISTSQLAQMLSYNQCTVTSSADHTF